MMTYLEILGLSALAGAIAVFLGIKLGELWEGDFLKVSILLILCIFAKIPIIGRYLLYVGLIGYNWVYKKDNQNV